MKQITSIKELREQIDKGNHSYCIMLNGGLRSSKYIELTDSGDFSVFNGVDGSFIDYTEAELLDTYYTNIGYAMERGAFYMD